MDYLTVNDDIDKIVNDLEEYSNWFKLFDVYDGEELKMMLARYLETDDNILSLNYISGILRLKLNEFDNADGKRRLLLAMNQIKYFKEQEIDDIIKLTLEKLTDYEKEIYVNTILEWDEEYAYKLYRYIQNDSIYAKLIIDLANKVISIGGNIYDRLRKDE